MQPNELRIGNWVKSDTNKEYQIELSDFADWYYDHNSHEFGNYIKPIPLTEEWLMKFGFELLPWGWVHGTLKDRAVLIRRSFTKDKYWIELGNGLVIDLPYVHTLQNFFILTGEELTIKTE